MATRLTVIDAVADVSEWISTGRARELRLEAGLSLAEAAVEVEVGPSTLFRWERGDRRPRGRNLRAYHQLLTALETRARRVQRTGAAA